MFPDLRTFMDRLRAEADLVTITAPVDAHLEAAEIHRRVIAAGGPALLFTNVRGKDFPLATNLFGTPRRAELAFGTRPLRLIKRIVELAWLVSFSDAEKHAEEEHTVRKIAGLLHVTHPEFIDAKIRAREAANKGNA